MKKIYMFVIGLLILGIATAGVISQFSITNASFSVAEKSTPTEEIINFNCDGKKTSVSISEPDGNYDDNDLRKAISKTCSGEATNIVMNGLTYKQNKYGTRSFDETYLKIDECQKDGNYWWKDNTCNEISEGENCLNQNKYWYDDVCNNEPESEVVK